MMIIGSSSLLVNSQNSSFRFFLCVLVLYRTLYKREGFLRDCELFIGREYKNLYLALGL